MSALSEPVLFSVNLACNLLLFGGLISVGIAVSFRLVKNANPRLRYAVAAAAFLFAALAPLAVTFNGSINSSKFLEANNSRTADRFDEHFSERIFVLAPKTVLSISPPESEKTSNDFLNNFAAAVANSLAGKILFGFWILGALVFVFRDVSALRQLKKARQSWRRATDWEREELVFSDKTRLYFGEESPATVGFFRPVVVLPENFPVGLSLAQKRCIVRHELSHARWRDPLVNFVLRLIRALFWISPALWLLERIVAGERESAADSAAVLNHPQNESGFENARLNYAATLVAVAKHLNSNARRRSALLGANTIGLYNGSILENRVRRLLAHSSKTTSVCALSATMILAGSFVGLFFMPVAFRAEAIKIETQPIVIENQETEESSRSENANSLPSRNWQNKPPRLIVFVEKKENENKTGISNQNGNKPEHSSMSETENRQIPRVIAVKRKSPGTLEDAVDGSEDLMRKLGEEDAKRSGLNQKLDDLSHKVQGLDEARKNLGSNLFEVRQKAASQIDSLMRQTQAVNDSGRKPN